MEDHLSQYIAQGNAKEIINYLIGWAFNMTAFFALLYLLRAFLDQAVQGIVWKISRRYNNGDEILYNGKPARLVHIGLFYTEFTIYNMNDKKQIVGGFTLIVANDKLRDVEILKPLKNIEIPTQLKSILKEK